MKIVQEKMLINQGDFLSTPEWKRIKTDVTNGIKAIEWSDGSGLFTIYPQSGKKRGEGNGVKPIKEAFIYYL